MDKCKDCWHHRLIISENGRHPNCILSQSKAIDCITGKKSYFTPWCAAKEKKEKKDD